MVRWSGEDTKHQDLREPLDAQAFGALPSALTSAAHLEENIYIKDGLHQGALRRCASSPGSPPHPARPLG